MALVSGCIVKTAKNLITGILEREIAEAKDTATHEFRKQMLEQIMEEIKQLPECGSEVIQQKVKLPRKKSEYQEHMSVCLKEGKDFMACVNEWKSD